MDDQPQSSADDEAFIEVLRAGRYLSRSEVLDEGLGSVREREAQIAAVRAAVQRGLDDVKAGHVIDVEEGFAEIYAMLDDMEAARGA